MLRRKIATTLAACGMVMLLFGLSTLPAFGAEPSRVPLQPSPRPAVDPLRHSSGQAVQFGRVTGTVIDLATGAPAAGVSVRVGDDVVTSDANGNYDHWLPVGTYAVALALADGQGAPAQPVVTVTVKADIATVQHLSFRGAAAPGAVVAPLAPAAQTDAAAGSAAPGTVKDIAGTPPKRLPRTASPGYGPWTWLALGALLLAAGGVVGFAPVLGGRSAALVLRAHAANMRLLNSLLAAPARPAAHAPAQQGDLLAELLEREPRDR